MPDSGFGKNEKRRVELVCQINRRHAVNIKLIKFRFIIFDCPRRLHKINQTANTADEAKYGYEICGK